MPTPLQDAREPGGFWMTNRFVDLVLPLVKGQGALVYLHLCRALTPAHYPSVLDLAASCRLAPVTVVRKLTLLASLGELNEFDLRAIDGYPDGNPPSPGTPEESVSSEG